MIFCKKNGAKMSFRVAGTTIHLSLVSFYNGDVYGGSVVHSFGLFFLLFGTFQHPAQ